MSGNLKVNNEELRSLILECLKSKNSTQFESFYNYVYSNALEKNLIKENHNDIYSFGKSGSLENCDKARVQNILWDLIIEGIIRPGLGDGINDNLPFLHVTEKGNQILNYDNVTPYDPDSYFKILYKEIPNIDSVIIIYLTEALNTFRIGCLLSSTIALGCAYEKAFVLLVQSFINAIENSEMQRKFKKAVEGKTIKRQYDELFKYYNSYFKTKLTGDLKEGFENSVFGIFEMIRSNRNDAGHPKGININREELYANIIVFRNYLKKIYNTINWLERNKI